MSTKYSKISENDDFILLEPIVKNESDYQKNINVSTLSGYNPYIVHSQLVHHSMVYKLMNQRSRAKFQVLQKWEGTVEEIDGETIHVSLKDLSHKGVDEEAFLDFNDISQDDLPLVKLGAMFYWSLGYETHLDKQVRKSSLIKFKRLANINSSEFDTIHDRAKEIENMILFE